MTSLPIVPVKVKASGSDTPVLTCLLWLGIKQNILQPSAHGKVSCRRQENLPLFDYLGEAKKSITECWVFKLKVFNLDEHNFVELPNVFSTLKIPVSEESIHQKEDVNMYPNLKGILLPKIDACIGLLIGNGVPKALEPKEIRECTEQGPYAIWTMFGWMINSPFGAEGQLSSHRELHQSWRRTKPTICKVLYLEVQQLHLRQWSRSEHHEAVCNA